MNDEPRRPGRPPFRPTPVQRQQVEDAAILGASQDDIARVLGIDRNTLVKYFQPELSKAALHLRIEAMGQLRRSAKKGNVSAQKKLADWSESLIAAQEQGKDQDGNPAAPKKRGVKLGKKEQAQLEAKNAGDGNEWGEDLKFDGGLPN